MAKRTILQLVAQLGEGIDADEIESLNETIEASDIASILEQTYKEILNRKTWEFMKGKVRQLDNRLPASTELNTLLIPTDVKKITCLRYKDAVTAKFGDLLYLTACDFVEMVQSRTVTDAAITAILNEDGVELLTFTDRKPEHWTSFDEATITFDAYDVTAGTGNIGVDSVIIADVMPETDFTDPLAVLNIPERMETLVFNEALSTCNYRLRQTADPRTDRIARRQNISLRRNEVITKTDNKEATYGRNSRSGR